MKNEKGKEITRGYQDVSKNYLGELLSIHILQNRYIRNHIGEPDSHRMAE
jgi:hypothetical protein